MVITKPTRGYIRPMQLHREVTVLRWDEVEDFVATRFSSLILHTISGEQAVQNETPLAQNYLFDVRDSWSMADVWVYR